MEARPQLHAALGRSRDEDREVLGARFLLEPVARPRPRRPSASRGDGEVADRARARPSARRARRGEVGSDQGMTDRVIGRPRRPEPRSCAARAVGRDRLAGGGADDCPERGRPVRTSRRGSARGSSRRHRRGAVRRGACDPRLCSRSSRCSSWPRWPVPSPSACPGIRLIFGDPGGTPPPAVASPTAPATNGASAPPAGSSIDLGEQVDPASLADRVDFPVLFPSDPALGPPDAAYVSGRDEVALVWAPSDDLPPTVESDIGLLIMQFRGIRVARTDRQDHQFRDRSSSPSGSREGSGYWISGDPMRSSTCRPRASTSTRAGAGSATP